MHVDFPATLPSNVLASGLKDASFMRETRNTAPLQLLFFTVSKFCMGVIWAREGCLCFQMLTWDYWTDGNNHCAMPQIALLAVSKFQMRTLHI